jgi:D-glycero-alpha-D-manno-heptose-7-phosphate kinase
MRIDFAGGWTDVPAFTDREHGVVVNAAITLSVHVDFLMGDRRIRLHAEDIDEHVTIPSAGFIAYDGTLDLHKAALNMLPVTGGIEVLSRSDAPSGSGLGASGSLDVALLAGLARCREEEFEPADLAELGFQLETQELGLLGGKQDQYAAALGGFHEFTFRGDEVRTRRLEVTAEAAADLANHLVLAHTGHSHFSSQTHERVWQAFANGDSGVTQALHSIRDVAASVADTLEAGDWPRLATLVTENWRQQQRLDATIATPRSHEIEAAAMRAGAWGLKATGAGAGGCMAVFGPPADRTAIADAVRQAGATVLDVGFAPGGVAADEMSDGAGVT